MYQFWCITVIFNPAEYQSRLDNYFIFRDRLTSQNVNLLTIEMTFGNQNFSIPKDSNVIRLNSNSVMWQKERMINYALSQLPDSCDKVAWLDADLLLPDGWQDLVIQKLDKVDFLQLYEKVIHLKPGEKNFGGQKENTKYGIVWQSKTYGENWIPYRTSKLLSHAEPGFAWASKRRAIKSGLYDKLICGGGDNWLADCLLGSYQLHHYLSKLTQTMKSDMDQWKQTFNSNTDKSTDYLPIDVYHLWHGSVKDRGYFTRDLIFKEYNFNPKEDIKITNNVLEWASDKPQLHEAVINYFKNRKEDGQIDNP